MEKTSRPEEIEGSTQANAEDSSHPEGEFAVYEVGYHGVPTLSEANAAALAEELHNKLEKLGASIIAEEAPKRMTLAYRIERSVAGKREKYAEGWFGWIKFEAAAEAAKTLEAHMRDEMRVLRFIVVHTKREAIVQTPRAVFSSDRLEGRTIEKRVSEEKPAAPLSEAELDKSLEALVS